MIEMICICFMASGVSDDEAEEVEEGYEEEDMLLPESESQLLPHERGFDLGCQDTQAPGGMDEDEEDECE